MYFNLLLYLTLFYHIFKVFVIFLSFFLSGDMFLIIRYVVRDLLWKIIGVCLVLLNKSLYSISLTLIVFKFLIWH